MEDHTPAEDHGVSVSSFALNGSSLAIPLAKAAQGQALLSSNSQLTLQAKRSRRQLRPSTAPPKEEKSDIIPSAPPGLGILSEASSRASPANEPILGSQSQGRADRSREDDMHDALCALTADVSRPDLGILPSPFEPPASEESGGNLSLDSRTESGESDYDWASFITAYSWGRWDPHRTPNPPRSHLSPPPHYLYPLSEPASASPGRMDGRSMESSPKTDALRSSAPCAPVSPNEYEDRRLENLPVATSNPSSPVSAETSRSSMTLKLPSHRMRNSFADLRSSGGSGSPNALHLPVDPFTSSSSNSDLTTAAATMRWAAARVNLSPLALPSPEHELTDPMRGVTAAIPGSHPMDIMIHPGEPMTPGGTRRTRLTTFWQGTQDVEENDNSGRLSTIEASPPVSPHDSTAGTSLAGDIPDDLRIARHNMPLPASAPLMHASDSQPGEYFSTDHVLSEEKLAALREKAVVSRRISVSNVEQTSSVPALPRRVCLTRQTSSPLPGSSTTEQRIPGGRVASENITVIKGGRAAKEEQMFLELGFLAPPNPQDELERRRALYKFNIWNTGPDTNFDRIAHLAKLVFSTKGVFISLIDGNEQWLKSEWGMASPSHQRIHSFCAHAILQRGDEPMVVLDTAQDWRFAANPLVTDAPHIRFYAGAPLRTQEGYNIGSLAVIDDAPRQDFTPRQRHTLKEFAAIAMREMELWRDKIQLRIRDRIQNSMEQFSRECLEIDTEAQAQHKEDRPDLVVGASMDKVYDRAAKLVKRTLDVEGVIVMDVSHCEVLETMSAEGSVSVVMHYGDSQKEKTMRSLTVDEYTKLNAFFERNPDGKISEGIVPPSFRGFLPTHIQYALTVPIFNIDKRPFALLCAYNASDHTKRFLEGHELSYLRAIGVIILSAVLKRRMILADKAKSLFISNISHELRTPLHGILAAAELLTETPLNHSQISFLQTVQACGTSLVETVNHVLDFTKLSGNSKSGGVDNVIVPTKVDLMQLVEEAVDGCWIGHRARTSVLPDSEIGSVYSPPAHSGQFKPVTPPKKTHVETVVDVGRRPEGWTVMCEKGGMRRVLMNLFGNSLKFTSDGYVHVGLRQIPSTDDVPPNKIRIELSVLDSGKGISQNFLKNQLFHPFSQENPLQTGTGLGLAIVNSIVRSESVGGKVDVWSEEGVGTEIKILFLAEVVHCDNAVNENDQFKLENSAHPPSVSLVGFDHNDRGVHLLHGTISTYLITWWGFNVRSENEEYGDIVIVNEDPAVVIQAAQRRDISRPFIILSSHRGSPQVMAVASEYERVGGFCRILYKPGGPSRLRAVLKLCLHALNIGHSQDPSPNPQSPPAYDTPESVYNADDPGAFGLSRRNSDLAEPRPPSRPPMSPRAATIHPIGASWSTLTSTQEKDESEDEPGSPGQEKSLSGSTISVGSGGTLLKSSVGTLDVKERSNFRVLVVEDNSILRNLLAKWLTTKGYDFRDAVDGRDGVNVYAKQGPFDVVLLDLSMPVLDGVGATVEIRQIESSRGRDAPKNPKGGSTRILALTGMSSLEDKRRAFEAGVDGYLVKPVAFKTLDQMFHKLGVS